MATASSTSSKSIFSSSIPRSISSSHSPSANATSGHREQCPFRPLPAAFASFFPPSTTHMTFLYPCRPATSPRSSVNNEDRLILTIRRWCTCSPSNHPGSFRCSLHKNRGGGGPNHAQRSTGIGSVEGEWARRALAAMTRPSTSQQRRRREAFRPKPSRLSVMSMAHSDDHDRPLTHGGDDTAVDVTAEEEEGGLPAKAEPAVHYVDGPQQRSRPSSDAPPRGFGGVTGAINGGGVTYAVGR